MWYPCVVYAVVVVCFDPAVRLSSRGPLEERLGRNRTKRWVWTDFLSQATGLSRIKDVKGVADNQEKIRFTQIKDEEEIVKIEKEENSLLKEIKDSDAKLEDLFRDEKIVSKKLSDRYFKSLNR